MNYKTFLQNIQKEVSYAILITPTGSIREDLAQANIFIGNCLEEIKEREAFKHPIVWPEVDENKIGGGLPVLDEPIINDDEFNSAIDEMKSESETRPSSALSFLNIIS